MTTTAGITQPGRRTVANGTPEPPSDGDYAAVFFMLAAVFILGGVVGWALCRVAG